MKDLRIFSGIFSLLFLACFLVSGCAAAPEPGTEPVATPTPTEMSGVLPQLTEASRPCTGLSGSLEMQILVGPSEAVGMEPVAVGEIPFSVVSQGETDAIEGGGPINFAEQVYEAEWGTYSVTFAADTQVSGKCESSDKGEVLDMVIVMEGEQMVSVRAEGFSGDYPWSGTQTLEVRLPAEDGVSQSGEGWTLVLHLGQ